MLWKIKPSTCTMLPTRMIAEASIPVRVVSLANFRGHLHARAKIVAQQRKDARLVVRDLMAQIGHGYPQGCKITVISVILTRCGGRKLDSDNLVSAFKAVRDGVAEGLGVDDGDASVAWSCWQDLVEPQQTKIGIEFSFDGLLKWRP